MKRLLGMVLAVCMIIGSMPVMASEYIGTQYDDFLYYEVAYDNTIIITDCDEAATDIVIPSTIDGLPVTDIASDAFSDCSSLTSVTIPDSVISISYGAFGGCRNLTDVYISSLDKWCGISFGSYMGYSSANPLVYAKNLYVNNELVTDLVIPDSVTSIGSFAFFHYSRLTSITIPDSVTSIGGFAFSVCKGLTNVIIPDGVISIGQSVFEDCENLESIEIPDSVTSIGSSAFGGCRKLDSVYISDLAAYLNIDIAGNSNTSNPMYYANKLYINNEMLVGTVIIPDGIVKIPDFAFEGCDSLENIIIPNSVTSINKWAFARCNGITSVTIGDGVTSIGVGAFDSCENLTDVYYGGTEEQWKSINIDSIYNGCLKNATIHYNSLLEPCFIISGSNVVNTSDKRLTADVIIVEYNDNGALENISSRTIVFESEATQEFTVSTNSKIFVWNSLFGMKPLTIQ